MLTIENRDVSEMSDAELCVEIALRRGLESRHADKANPYVGWHDVLSFQYFNIQYCSDAEAAWELLEWLRGKRLMLTLGSDTHFPDATLAYVTKEPAHIGDKHGWEVSNVKRALAIGVLYYLRMECIGEGNVSWKYEDGAD